MTKLKVILKRSLIGSTARQRATATGLGLKRIRQERVLNNTPAIRGMIKQIIHLVDVSEINISEGADGAEA
jgi:large subunit ribosomal protein L30